MIWLLLWWLLFSIFGDFEQVKKVVILLTLNKSRKLTAKLPQEKPDAYAFFCLGHCLMSPALHPGFSDLWGSPPALSSTPTLWFFFAFECIGIQFFNSLTCDCGTPCRARGHSHSYLGKRRISLGVTIILGMRLCPHT